MSNDLVLTIFGSVQDLCCLALRGVPGSPGRRPIDDVALDGVLFVLHTNVSWRDVPAENIGCSGITCLRRHREWTQVGVWLRLHAARKT